MSVLASLRLLIYRGGLFGKEAGVTRGAVYWHFKNKLDIFRALHEQLYISFSEQIFNGIKDDPECPLKSLKELCVDLLVELETTEKKRKVLAIFFIKCHHYVC